MLAVHIVSRVALAHLVDHDGWNHKGVVHIAGVDGLAFLVQFHGFELSQDIVSNIRLIILAHLLRVNFVELMLEKHLLEVVVLLDSLGGLVAEVLVHLA